MEWIRCVGVANNYNAISWHKICLIAPNLSILQQVSCSYETIPNAPKYYETHQNISLVCNGADWVHSLWKIPVWLCGTNFCINCTTSPHFVPNFMQFRNDSKCTQTLWNAPKHEFRVWIGCIYCEEFRYDFVAWTFALIAAVRPILHRV